MSIERRGQDRHPSFASIELIAKDGGGNQREIPIMTRDRSLPGLGGVYVGQDPHPEEEFILHEPGKTKTLRLAWKKKVADYVCIVGFEYVDS